MKYDIGERVFNDWEIVREIGSGASGTVWEIVKKDHDITTSSALKVIQVPQSESSKRALSDDGLDEASITSYFQKLVNELTDEIKIMIDMKGFPYIVNCEDYKVIKCPNEAKWEILIRMELLTPLQTYIQKHVLSEADIIKIGRELLEALSLFESKGILHRDIKPDNIFIDNYGNAKIGDFGIARICDKESVNLSIKGTENYMAPEVYQGKEYSSTADIYSLGLVLYKLLNNNRLPFYPTSGEYDDWDVQRAHIDRLTGNRELPVPCSASPEISKIILRMCTYNPKERYQSAKEVLEDLSDIAGSTIGIVGVTSEEASATSNKDKSYNETRLGSIDGMIIHNGDVIKKTGKSNKTGMTGQSRDKKITPGSKSITEEKNRSENEQDSAEKEKDPEDRDSEEPVIIPEKKRGIKKKKIIRVLALIAVAGSLLLYVLTNKTYSLTVTDGTGSGTYKGGKLVTVTAKDVAGKTFIKWDADGKIPLSEQELTEKTISFKMPRHELSLNAVYEANIHNVIVNDGTGEGEYKTGDEVTIAADEEQEGMEFSGWDIEDGSVSLEHANKPKTSFIMPDDDVEVSATYKALQYSLQVKDGQGSGQYEFHKKVTITADDKEGETFHQWEVADGSLKLTEDEAQSQELTFSMPAGDLTIKASYETNVHKLTVNGGSGSGSYNVGDKVTVTAEDAGIGKAFEKWEVEEGSADIPDKDKESITFDMPDEEIVLTAVYQDIDYKLTVTDGNGSGTYHYNDPVSVSAKDTNNDIPFSHWTLDKGTLDLSDLSEKNITFKMPAEDIALTAHYSQPKYTLTVQSGEGSGVFDAGSSVTISADAEDESGNVFARWEVTEGSLQLEDPGSREITFTMPAEKTVIKAVYETAEEAGAYSVLVFGGSGGGVYKEGDIVTVTAKNVPGKTFNCWYITAEESETVENDNAEFSFEMPATDLIITAMYDLE